MTWTAENCKCSWDIHSFRQMKPTSDFFFISGLGIDEHHAGGLQGALDGQALPEPSWKRSLSAPRSLFSMRRIVAVPILETFDSLTAHGTRRVLSVALRRHGRPSPRGTAPTCRRKRSRHHRGAHKPVNPH